MVKQEKELISVRIDRKQLNKLKQSLGLDDSKTIRACLNCTEFVIHHWFKGELQNIFRRNRKDETKDCYDFD